MICRNCAKAADQGKYGAAAHKCNQVGCTCQHRSAAAAREKKG